MKVTLKLFASLAVHLPPECRRTNFVDLDVEPGATPGDLIRRFSVPPEQCALVLVNGIFVGPEAREGSPLAEGDVVAIWPPVAGG
jgi:molybdopterin converting factor small subunit